MSYKSGASNAGTGHLNRHLINKHGLRDESKEGEGVGVQSTIDPITGKVFYFNKIQYRLETMKFTIGSALPFSFADGWRYKKWIREAVNPKADRIPRTSMRTLALQYFKNEKHIISSMIANLPWKVCLTSDIATFLEFDIMCVTLHWIDSDWVLQRRIIYFRAISKHNAEQISDGLVQCMVEFNAKDKIMAISFDNASANTASIERLKMECNPEFKSLFHTRCLCHILQLVAKDGIKVIWDEFIEPIRKAVLLVITSGARKREYKALVKASGKKFKKLIMDVETRWNSTYDLLVRAYLFKDELTCFYETNRPRTGEYYQSLTQLHWAYCHEMIYFLATFKEYTMTFSSQYSPNIHLALECVVNLSMHLHAHRDKYVCRDMVPVMEVKFLKYFHPIPYAYAIGCILHPGRKMTWFHTFVDYFYQSIMPGSDEIGNYDRAQYCQNVESYLYRMYARYVTSYGNNASSSSSLGGSISGGSKVRSRHNYVQMAMQNSPVMSTSTQDCNELTQFLQTPFDLSMFDDDNPIDVLAWWKSKSVLFPILSRLAKEVLAIPMSTVASESAFSMAKLQYTARRSRLTSQAIEVCVAIKDWTAAEHRMQDKEYAMEEHQKDMFDELSDIEDEVVDEDAIQDDDEYWYETDDEIPEEDNL